MNLHIIWILIIGLTIAYYAIDFITYTESTYYKTTHKSYIKVKFNSDLGDKGEYLTYKELKKYEENGGKFLFNLYLPKNDDETTEADVVMIHKTGIYVFESKNHSGWIFGDEKSRTWTQTLPQGNKSKKNHFLNPIWQNKLHIKCLNDYLNKEIPFHSIVVFSVRCELKKVTVYSPDIKVVKRDVLKGTVQNIIKNSNTILEENEINEIYNKLYPLTQVSNEVKTKHIENINKDRH